MKKNKRKSRKSRSKAKDRRIELSVVVMPREIKRVKLKQAKIVALSETLKEIYAITN